MNFGTKGKVKFSLYEKHKPNFGFNACLSLNFTTFSLKLFVIYYFSVDISLYEGEDQLDEIDRRRKGDEDDGDESEPSSSAEKPKPKKRGRKPAADTGDATEDKDKDYKKEIKIKVKPPKKPANEPEVPRRRVEKRKSAENARNALDAFEFANSSEEEGEKEVMPRPKKRKSAVAAPEAAAAPATAEASPAVAKGSNKEPADKASEVQKVTAHIVHTDRLVQLAKTELFIYFFFTENCSF